MRNSFTTMFGGTVGVFVGIGFAVFVVPMLCCGGCLLIGTATAPIVERAEREAREAEAAQAAAKRDPQPAVDAMQPDPDRPLPPILPLPPPEQLQQPATPPPAVPQPNMEQLRREAEERKREEAERQAAEAAKAERTRTWSTADGKFTVEAEFAGKAFDRVKLRKADGSEIWVDLGTLCEADREWVAAWLRR